MSILAVFTTYPDMENARHLAEELVSLKLAACVNIMPRMTSVYEWKGKIENGHEHLMIIKTSKAKYQALEQKIKASHPYELPEIIALPVETGLKEYLNWIENNSN